jgi:hypothetical protein
MTNPSKRDFFLSKTSYLSSIKWIFERSRLGDVWVILTQITVHDCVRVTGKVDVSDACRTAEHCEAVGKS